MEFTARLTPATLLAAWLTAGGLAHATPPPATGADLPPAPEAGTEPGFTTQLFGPSRGSFLGDAFGLRSALGTLGLDLTVQETSEILGNVSGGLHQGAAYDGLTTLTLQLDTQRAFGLAGGTLNISALQIHGRNLSADNLATLQTASGIEASRATRLWELWYDQVAYDGHVDVKIGQQSLDQEFLSSAGSSLYLNTMMGWPLLPSVDLYAGGPAYPLSSLGARLRLSPTSPFTLLAGVFDDNPPGGDFANDGQTRGGEQSGTAFHIGTGALFIAELQYARNLASTGELDAPDSGSAGRPGLYKLGVWYDTAAFPDQRYDTNGVSLASPASNGNPALHRHDYSFYGVFDQTLWQPDPNKPRGIGIFARLMGAPGDRNLVSFSVNAGINFKAPLVSRPYDTLGLGFGFGKIGDGAIGFDRDNAAQGGGYAPIRSAETFVELTYQVQLAPWWQIQPDFQYVFLPGGGIANPLAPASRIGNEAVFGLRTNVTF